MSDINVCRHRLDRGWSILDDHDEAFVARDMAREAVAMSGFEAMVDGSGAPAVIRVDGRVFAFDMLGEVRCNALGAGAVRGRGRVAQKIARATYAKLVAGLSGEWHAANRAMYA